MSNSKEAVLAYLSENGYVKAEVDFQGGNDEGYCENIDLIDTDGETISVSAYYGATHDVIPEWVNEALQEPVYNKYGSFAGDFQVYGRLIWDAENKRVFFNGEESQYVPFSEEV